MRSFDPHPNILPVQGEGAHVAYSMKPGEHRPPGFFLVQMGPLSRLSSYVYTPPRPVNSEIMNRITEEHKQYLRNSRCNAGDGSEPYHRRYYGDDQERL